MKTYNIYFSPTGGTKKVSDIISSKISKDSHSVDLMMKCEYGQYFTNDDLCIISVPAYGGRVPTNAIEKIKTFRGNGAKAILVAVFGNRAIDDTLIELYDIAMSCGFEVVAGIEAIAEHSLARMYAEGRPDANDKLDLEEFAEKIICKIANKENTKLSIPGNRPYKETKSSAMQLVVDDSCMNCKKCAKECPVDAIPMENIKAVNEDKCFSCMHCVYVCPVKARHNSTTLMKAIEERLKDRCAERKINKIYI